MKGAFKALYFLSLLVFAVIRIPHQWTRRKMRLEVDRRDGVEYLVMSLTLVGMFFVPVVYASTSWLDGADYRGSSKAKERAGGIGTAIMSGALWLLWRSHKDLGHNFSPSLQLREGHTLVTGGVYQGIRHPIYAAIWLWGIGQALLLQNRIAGWAGLVLFLPLYLLRVPREERMMLEQFGDAYRDYMSRTGRVIPHPE
jgi:protein-S-isoprenylcysteine O-methyltransferase Ste14